MSSSHAGCRTSSRRDFLALLSSLPALGVASSALFAQTMPTRKVPSSGEALPMIGLGSSKVVEEIAQSATSRCGRSCGPCRARRQGRRHLGRASPPTTGGSAPSINEPAFRDRLFVTGQDRPMGREAGIAQFREVQQLYGRKTIDLVDLQPHRRGHALADPAGVEGCRRGALHRRHRRRDRGCTSARAFLRARSPTSCR